MSKNYNKGWKEEKVLKMVKTVFGSAFMCACQNTQRTLSNLFNYTIATAGWWTIVQKRSRLVFTCCLIIRFLVTETEKID